MIFKLAFNLYFCAIMVVGNHVTCFVQMSRAESVPRLLALQTVLWESYRYQFDIKKWHSALQNSANRLRLPARRQAVDDDDADVMPTFSLCRKASETWTLSGPFEQAGPMCPEKEWSMDVKERRPYCSLTKSRREKERRYTNSSADNEECRVPTQKSYSSSETLKAFDHDSSRLLYGNRVKDLVHREADEYTRQGRYTL